MDGRRFDDLSRSLAASASRRQALRFMAGGAAGLLAALGARGATGKCKEDDPSCKDGKCRDAGASCKGDDKCCPGLVCEGGACAAGCRIDGVYYPPEAPAPGNPCLACRPAASTTSWTADDGAACDDGNACTVGDACLGGACVAGSPVVCTASDQCHDPGVCDPATGLCSNPTKADYTPCNDGNACSADVCFDGVCHPFVTVGCPDCLVCDPRTGGCVVDPGQDGKACRDGGSCCNGSCVDFQTDERNCGGCGTICGADEQCVDGACGRVCAPPSFPCTTQSECCGGLQCQSPHQNCGEPLSKQCCYPLGPAPACTRSCDCCDTFAVCGLNADGVQSCCRQAFDFCTTSSDCCQGLTCTSAGRCV